MEQKPSSSSSVEVENTELDDLALILSLFYQFIACFQNHLELMTFYLEENRSFSVSPPIPPPPQSLQSVHSLAKKLLAPVIEWSSEKYTRPSTCNEILKDEHSLFVETHFTKQEFNSLFELVDKELELPLDSIKEQRKIGDMNSKQKLLLVLMWIRRYKTEEELAIVFGTSASTICKWLTALTIRLSEKLKPEIRFPTGERLEALKVSIDK